MAGPKLSRAIPVLPSLDLAESVEFYVSTLGFREVLHRPDEYAIVRRDDVELHFWSCPDPEIPKASSCRIRVDDIDALYAELEPKGIVHPNSRLSERPWGLREFAIVDEDGNLVTFAEPIE